METRTRRHDHERIIGARTPMRLQLLHRIDTIVQREAATQQAGLRGWHVEAILTDARVSGSRGHVVALRARRRGPAPDVAIPWAAIRSVGLRIAAEEWAVATVVPDVSTPAPVVEPERHEAVITIGGCTLDLRDIGIDVLTA